MEARKEIKPDDKKSILTLENRKRMCLNGVIEVVNFNDQQIILNTNLGMLSIKNSNLKMNKLDVQNGEIVVVGQINSYIYTGTEAKDKESILSKLFK